MTFMRLGEECQNCIRHSKEITQVVKVRHTTATHDAKDHTRHSYKGLWGYKQEITNSAWVLVQKCHIMGGSQDDWKQKDKYTALPRSTLGFPGLEVVGMGSQIHHSLYLSIWHTKVKTTRNLKHPASISIDWWLNYLGLLMNE